MPESNRIEHCNVFWCVWFHTRGLEKCLDRCCGNTLVKKIRVSFPVFAGVCFSAAYLWPLRFQSGVFDSAHFILHLKNKSRPQQSFRVLRTESNSPSAWQTGIFIDNCFIMQTLEFYMASCLFVGIGTLLQNRWNHYELGSEMQIRWWAVCLTSLVWY